MNEVHEVELAGCTPEPLMNYLKAVGILRLVSEQADPNATGCWRNDRFLLRSKLDPGGLVDFFVHACCPTPIISPWAGGSGFFGNDNRKAVDAIGNSASSRAAAYRSVIARAKWILKEEGITERPSGDVKDSLLRRYRREMPDQFVQWMDAAMVLQSDGQAFAPVLGTGGNDGRLDFAQNFMQRVVELGLHGDRPPQKNVKLLRHSLFGATVSGLGGAAVGQFSPGRAGGPNATQGMEGNPTDNPWDFVLMLEGALVLAGSVVRRFGLAATDKAAFPFTVRARPVGDASPSDEELGASRGELWLPLWSDSTCRAELEAMFAEGRADLKGRPARDAIDFARAVAELGVDRGVGSFARFGFFKRSGKAYLATAMDRFPVPERPREATRLLQEVDRWLDRFGRACSAKETPGRLKFALRRIESAIFDYCRYGKREELQAILVSLGRAERELAVTGGQRGGKDICRPLGPLSSQWLKATCDSTPEFHIALALAGIHASENDVGSIRCNLEPAVFERGRWNWGESGPSVVWNRADLSTNMIAVLARRLMDGARAGTKVLPFDFRWPLAPNVIAAFIAGDVDDSRIQDLLWGLILVDHRQTYPEELALPELEANEPLPRTYALLKLLFLPRQLCHEFDSTSQRGKWRFTQRGEEGISIRPEPRVLPLLRTRHVGHACQIAYQRLLASGLNPMPGPRPSGASRADAWTSVMSVAPERLAAALLLPIGNRSLRRIVHLVTRQDDQTDTVSHSTEGGTQL